MRGCNVKLGWKVHEINLRYCEVFTRVKRGQEKKTSSHGSKQKLNTLTETKNGPKRVNKAKDK